jgi:hypothetical protein
VLAGFPLLVPLPQFGSVLVLRICSRSRSSLCAPRFRQRPRAWISAPPGFVFCPSACFSLSLGLIFLLSVLHPAVPQLSLPLCLRQDATTYFLLRVIWFFPVRDSVLMLRSWFRLFSCAGDRAQASLWRWSSVCRVSVALPPVPSFGLCPLLMRFDLSSQLVFCGKVVRLDLLHLAQPVAACRPQCGPWRSQSRLFIFPFVRIGFCVWATRSNVWVFLLLVVFYLWFIYHVFKVFGEICERHWVALLSDFNCWGLVCDFASIDCCLSLCFLYLSSILYTISFLIAMWSWPN